MKEAGVAYELISDLAAEPICDQAQDVVDEFRNKGCDFIVAVGGGSVMDTASFVLILATDEYQVRDLLDNPKLAKKCVKSLMIPTTAGTGAEATPKCYDGLFLKRIKSRYRQ
ncbi:MAG: iron-containing alcohol dehydrogenase [Coprococcus sp.]